MSATIVRLDTATDECTTLTRDDALAELVVKPWHDLYTIAILLDHATVARPVRSEWADYWPATPALCCDDKLCPWSVDPTNPDASALAADHATEHEGGRRSNAQAARAAAESHSLRRAGDRQGAGPA